MTKAEELCDGKLQVLFADESSYRCTVCGWIGWPRMDVMPGSGIITRYYPHHRRVMQEWQIGEAVADREELPDV